ncbi:ABC transporter substrate-binding protein [Microbacterium sp. zg.Y909]|uniref:ABC transporter substrate-binding protein n=1 Tax=Microbacterium sp. zg.Y909 TaxID=2969413 RepID=UPI00214CB29A|nr:sugar ABC transporter substrate-binding protein [Microbacterium sp. zg.Y909]MCR2825077.1 sugar ABC transporter substrate-binding protein [Microbacterium sp. zg.Y909]
MDHYGKVATRPHRVAGVGVLATITVLAGCAAGGGTTAGPDTEIDEFDWRNFEGTELNLLMSEHPFSNAISEYIPEFEELTGVSVNLETLTETDYMVKLLTELQSGSGSYDAFMTSQPMNYQYAAAGWIEDLLPWVEDETRTAPDWDFDDFYPALIESLRWDKTEYSGAGQGGLWALPVNEEGYALFYRQDILEANGIAVPQTVDELIAAAEQLDGTEFDGRQISGFVSRGDKTYPTLNPFSTFLMAYGGTDIVDGKAAVNSPESVAAAEKWVEIMQYAPDAASTYTWYEAQQDFIAGNAAFYIDADHMAPDFEKSAIAGTVGYALPPEGPAGRGSSMWVWSLGMNAASDNKDAAWQFLQWASSKETLTSAIANGNMNPTRISVAESPEMAEATAEWGNYNQVWQEILADYASWAYTPAATWPQAGDIWTIEIQAAVLGQKSVKEAMDDAAAQIDQLIAE